MIQRLYVAGELFWIALSHCRSPVFLPDDRYGDLRQLPRERRESVIPAAGRTAVELRFVQPRDYVRFVLAYLLSEEAIP